MGIAVLCPIHTADGTKLFCRVGVGGVNTNSQLVGDSFVVSSAEMGYLVLVLVLKYIFYVLVLVLASEVLVLVLVLGT